MIDKKEARLVLEKEIQKTEELIKEYKEITKPIAPDVAIGRVSRIDAIQNKSVAEGALRLAQDKMDKLKYLLSQVESPDFGICLKCKNPIPLGRFIARPESLYCVRCAK